jgi:hypothetical protein
LREPERFPQQTTLFYFNAVSHESVKVPVALFQSPRAGMAFGLGLLADSASLAKTAPAFFVHSIRLAEIHCLMAA